MNLTFIVLYNPLPSVRGLQLKVAGQNDLQFQKVAGHNDMSKNSMDII